MSKSLTFFFAKQEELSYKKSYITFSQMAEKYKIDIRYAFATEDYKNGKFMSYRKYIDGQLQFFKRPYTPGLIYLRDRIELPSSFKRINNSILEAICRDKLLTHRTFPDLVKKTMLLGGSQITDDIKTEKVVIKPRYGSNGKEVKVLKKTDVSLKTNSNTEYVIQELIDSSQGITGLINRRHELRVFVFDGEISAAYIRIPAENSYLANISQGGKEMKISLADLPTSAHEIIQEIDKKFLTISPRIYTVDIMYENNKPWIVELNDIPGMPDISVQPFTNDYFTALLEFVKKHLE
jgi:glutathione synthase/RimK-type ligase-like ATP-grasp enzyme